MRITGFIWLDQYVDKLLQKHHVTTDEVEALFDSRPHYRFVEKGYVPGENLYVALGQLESGRYLAIFFIHKLDGRALVISARKMNEDEKRLYARR